MKGIVSSILIFCAITLSAQKNASVSFEKWISLKGVGSPIISPDGRTVVFSVTSTDWTNNSYDSELWMSRDGQTPVQLTRTSKNNSTAARCAPNNQFISFLADRGEKTQLYIIYVHGGEAMQVTKDEDGINSYEWSPDGSKIAYVKAEQDSKKDKTTKERFGAFGVEGEEYKQSHLWLLNFHYDSIVWAGQVPCYTVKRDSTKTDSLNKIKGQECFALPVAKKLTEGNFNVGRFLWNPDGKSISFVRQPDPLINSFQRASIVSIDISTKKIITLIDNPTGDFLSAWAPDGKSFIYSTNLNDSVSNFYKNPRFFIYDLNSANSREVMQDIDENKSIIDWNNNGIFFTAFNKMKGMVYQFDPKSNKTKAVTVDLDLVGNIAFSKNTDKIAVSGRKYTDINEIHTGQLDGVLKKITNSSAQIAKWNTPVNEIISWKSTDGATIEGVLL